MKSRCAVSTLRLLGAIVCCGLVASAGLAQTGEVYSLNVVGFQKVTAVSGGLTMVSTPFSRSPATIDDVIGDQMTRGKTEGSADNVIIWYPSSQTYSTYVLKTDGFWYTLDGTRATNTGIDTELGFWLRNRAVTDRIVVVSGDVPEDDIATNVLLPGLSMVSYPFSTEVMINDSGLTNGLAGKTEGSADNIIIWDPDTRTYKTYVLKSSDHQWYDLSNNKATNVFVGAGRGFWYRNRAGSNFEWVEARPYTL